MNGCSQVGAGAFTVCGAYTIVLRLTTGNRRVELHLDAFNLTFIPAYGYADLYLSVSTFG